MIAANVEEDKLRATFLHARAVTLGSGTRTLVRNGV
jgi:hypothetical protein